MKVVCDNIFYEGLSGVALSFLLLHFHFKNYLKRISHQHFPQLVHIIFRASTEHNMDFF